MNLNFDKKIAVVVGASRGIGKKVSEDLELLGAKVHRFSSSDYDLSKADEVLSFCYLLERLERLDILVYSAGIIGAPDNADEVFDINALSALHVMDSCYKVMSKAKRGHIVTIGSIAANRFRSNRAAYSSSKAALVALTKSKALDFAEANVLVNCVSPGPTLTDMISKSMSENEIDELSKLFPLKRIALPSDISNMVMFMCSDNNRFMTGQNIVVDGGLTLRSGF